MYRSEFRMAKHHRSRQSDVDKIRQPMERRHNFFAPLGRRRDRFAERVLDWIWRRF